MFVVDTIPFKNIPAEQSQIFSYFSQESLEIGSIIEVPIRNKPALALVVDAADLSKNKALVKKYGFSLKPIKKILSAEPIFSQKQIKLAEFISNYYFTPLSLTFKKLFLYPKTFYKKVSAPELEKISGKRNWKGGQKFYTQSFDKFLELLEKIKNSGVLVLVPDSFWQSFISEKLNKAKVSHFNYSKVANIEKLRQGFEAAINGRVIIARKEGLFLPFRNLGLVAIFEEQSSLYKSQQKPLFNAKYVGKKLAEFYNADFLYVTSSLSSVDIYLGLKNKEIIKL